MSGRRTLVEMIVAILGIAGGGRDHVGGHETSRRGVTRGASGRRSRFGRGAATRLAVSGFALVGAIALSACGSSKPAYCTNRANLEKSVKNLTSTNFNISEISAVKSKLTTIESEATTLVNSAKSDFPSESSALKSSVEALESAVKGLSSSPTPGQIAAVASSASSAVNSFDSFVSATKSKCE